MLCSLCLGSRIPGHRMHREGNPPTQSSKNRHDVVLIQGLANVGETCAGGSAGVGIVEARTPGASFILAHEIAHTLGIYHDAVNRGCPVDMYIMAPSTGSGRR